MSKAIKEKNVENRFSEVISSIDEEVIAQCYKDQNDFSISQGCIVKIVSSQNQSYSAYGLVAKINNTSLDNIHRPSALGLSSSEIEMLQPQIYELLRKEVSIYLFAYKNNGDLIVESPPIPMMVHDFVYKTTDEEYLELTENINSIINIIKKHQLKIDLIVEVIKKAYSIRKNDYNYLLKAAKKTSLVFSDDFESLMLALKRIAPGKV